MKYIFCGYMFPEVEADIKKMKTPPSVSAHKFQINILKGLIENGQDVYVLNIPRYRYYPHLRKIIIKSSKFLLDGKQYGQNVGFLNLPGINYITQYFALKRATTRCLKENTGECTTLISFNGYLPRDKAMLEIKRKNKNILLCNVLGDLHGKYGTRVEYGLKKKIVSCIENKDDELLKEYDAFAFLTKYMTTALGVEQKPSVIVEGMFADPIEKSETVPTDEKVIFYAGAVSLLYDIRHLLDAFEMVKGSNYRLRIAGSGDAVDTVKEYAIQDPRIEYLGRIAPSEVASHQQRATVLVNPRTSGHEYVKYSFPSKNMECLASGKPCIAHDLICNPPEYKEYIQYPADESDEALAHKIVEICELPEAERAAIGRRAREFILREKNPKKQMEKVVRMLQTVEGTARRQNFGRAPGQDTRSGDSGRNA